MFDDALLLENWWPFSVEILSSFSGFVLMMAATAIAGHIISTVRRSVTSAPREDD